jgi:hypothetical protein
MCTTDVNASVNMIAATSRSGPVSIPSASWRQLSSVNIETIRCYEKVDLVPAASRAQQKSIDLHQVISWRPPTSWYRHQGTRSAGREVQGITWHLIESSQRTV